MAYEDVYSVIKQRNREMAVGTFIDWKIKQSICSGTSRSVQDCMVELSSRAKSTSWWFHKNEAYESNSMRIAKLEVFFANLEAVYRNDSEGHERYVAASRYLSLFNSKKFAMIPSCRKIYEDIEKMIHDAYRVDSLGKREIEDEFVLSQVMNFFVRGKVDEIQAMSAPCTSYQGMPDGFETFIDTNLEHVHEIIRECMDSVGATSDNIIGDYPLSSDSIIMGEADMVAVGDKTCLFEVKCNNSCRASDLRDPGCAKHLLQVFAYVALGRHGAFPLEVDWGCIVNPLTATWEMYDFSTWSRDDSKLFLQSLEELRARA
jgi:hypothetical protein